MTQTALQLADELERGSYDAAMARTMDRAAAELRRLAVVEAQRDRLLEALKCAEAGLADIGDADREPGDDLAWCEGRAAEALPQVRAAIAAVEEGKE